MYVKEFLSMLKSFFSTKKISLEMYVKEFLCMLKSDFSNFFTFKNFKKKKYVEEFCKKKSMLGSFACMLEKYTLLKIVNKHNITS